ncbi:MAG: hypothetical protein JNK25_01995 [Phycisphaerae bacterium]|nr:hypothetical protein [Phycisphaerae bacterium]
MNVPAHIAGRIVGSTPEWFSSAREASAVHRILDAAGRGFGTVIPLHVGMHDRTTRPVAADPEAERHIFYPLPPAEGELSWLPGARARFEAACDSAAADLHEPVLWPHSACAVGDAPSLATFLRARPRWRFIFDPISLLTPAMLDNAEEHLSRWCEVLGTHPRAAAVVIGSGLVVGDRVIPCGDGEPRGMNYLGSALLSLIARCCHDSLSVITPHA